ncbi:MAG: hypothetical protein OET90_06145 [Desulfuromonadales bacterium]|nr:hypothetical protein [Desulfuromonadales bacterium]
MLFTGWGVGGRYRGGFSQCAKVKSEWLTPLPDGLSELKAMAIGSAGLTAMLCVMALQELSDDLLTQIYQIISRR